MSDDLVDINWAILGVSRDLLDYQKISNNDTEIRQIIARVSMKNLIGLESCVYHLVNWFYELRDTDLLKPYLQDSLLMMNRYRSNNYPEGCEVSLIEEKLIQLAYVFRLWGNSDDIVDHFCDKLTESRFNNVRYSLFSRLKNDQILS